jgi:glyoxylase-like metal-dependent hydrolase (beta-lactamase superfamily II)
VERLVIAMGLLKCETLVVGQMQTNCYFLYDEDTKDCLIVDPGDEAEKIIGFIHKKEFHVKAILLTHGHFDHITAAEQVREETGVEIYASKEEQELLEDAHLNISVMVRKPTTLKADRWFEDGQEVEMLGQTMRCIGTPGHTHGGMCYYFPKAGILFSGDTLFQESVGRTDFPTGSISEMIASIREKLLPLPDAVRVFPGHGLMTTMQNERMFNPYAMD